MSDRSQKKSDEPTRNAAASSTDATQDLHERQEQTRSFPGNAEQTSGNAVAAKVGGTFGRYRTHRVLGAGGFGVVYLARDDELDRWVAVKVPKPQNLSSPGDIEAYLLEARTIARLEHPGIVPVYDVGRTEDVPYVVSKFVDGEDLRKRIQRSGLTIREASALIATLAETLDFVHGRGVVHRDIKPSNVLLDRQGTPFLTDFGLALRDADFGKGSTWAGTPLYMSPEQARGESHLVDGRSDVFSLGVLLYELLTGSKPFQGGTIAELVEQIVRGETPSLRQKNHAVPKELERVCQKALAKRSWDRYETAGRFAEDLRCFLVEYVSLHESGSGSPPAAAASPAGGASSRALAAIVPRGLRSYEEDDAHFFHALLPGPRDRNGLPDSIAFWKSRVEETDPDRCFRVGLVYGPSGCGKSSFVKAGLLPVLTDNVHTAFLEASPGQTEVRLLNALKSQCPLLPPDVELPQALSLLRRGHGLSAGRKMLIVIDQFEQWLHSEPDQAHSRLAAALRQCDGRHVQCVLLVRDDFWLAVSRFMDQLEIELVQNRNMTLVDLFDRPHARRVLAELGKGYGRLPGHLDEFSDAQERFLDDAVDGLAQDDRIIPVRLALFAEMIKARDWSLATLRRLGGITGVGTIFLEETFGSSTAPVEYRVHRDAVRETLRALLPDAGSDIRGHMRAHAELLKASGYDSRPRDFERLLAILDGELRLITPTDREADDGVAHDSSREIAPGARYFQLTHDYLVPAIREWITLRQKQTVRGRAELALSERAVLWDRKREARNLPSFLEWLRVFTLTRRRLWTSPQRDMMRAATRRNLVRLSGVLAAVVALVLLAGLWRDTVVTRTTVDRLLQAETADVPRILEELRGGRGFARRLLTAAADDPGLPAKQRLHAHLALLPEDPSRVDFLADAALQAGPDQLRVIADSLRPFGGGLAETYWRVLQDHQRPGGERLRAAALLADFAPADPRWRDQAGSLASHLVAASPLEAARWQPLLRPARPWLIGPLESAFLSRDAGEAARAVAAALLADYAADDPARLVELLTSADRRSFPPLLAALRPHGGAAVERLSSALARGPEARWVDEPVATGAVPGRAVAAALEAGGGLLGERFAFAAALPMADLDRLAGELARFGYRPCCFRPDGARAAVTWVRDGRKWEWLRDATAEAVRARDAACRRRGLLPADVAWTAGGFAALWVEPTPDLAEAELYVDVPEELHEKHWAPLNEREFVPRTDLITSDGAGRPRYTSVRWKLRRAPMQYLDTWGDDARDFAARVALGFCQVDVRLVRDPGGGEPRLGGAWWNGYGPESRVSPVLPVEGHSRWCRDQAAQGFRPVAVSAGGDAVVSLWLRPLPAEAERDAAARRQALAAVALLHLGRPQAAWERLRLSPEPRVRGWLTHALSETCADPALLLDRLGAEPDVSARRALLRALAEYPPAALDGDRVSALAAALLRTDPDPGVHSAAELLLRRLRPGDEARAPGAPPAPDRDWFRNGEGQTFAVVRGPVEFLMGSPGDEPNRATYDEPRRPVRIGHGFAVATTEVTVEQFLRYCRANAIALNVAYDYTPDLTCPVTMITWHEAAAYCNWLSEREGLPPCYEPDPDARPTGPDVGQVRPMRPKKDQLVLTGYRMPTEAEWEVACRAGTTTGRYYGFAEALLGRYAWTAANSGYRSWPVGRLLPNDLGLFDVLGNAMEFCDDIPRAGGKPDPGRRVIRGGAFLYEPSAARSAHHDTGPAAGLPADRKPYQGFRLVRTLD